VNVCKILSKLADNKANETAILFKESQFTYGNINAIANSLAKYLMGNGIRHRENIAVILPDCPEFAFDYFASAKIGAFFTPIDTRLGEKEVNSILTDTKTKVCFIYPDYPLIEKLNQSVRIIDIASDEFRIHVNNPAETKNIIFPHPSVVDSEVIGIYSEKEKGNILHAFVVPAQNTYLSENEIRSLCSKRLGSIKTPKKVSVLASIPKTSTGKTNIQELKNLTYSNDT
jgi:acyl-coenzyme A synthetase/AMP-(fatty) acid ligase